MPRTATRERPRDAPHNTDELRALAEAMTPEEWRAALRNDPAWWVETDGKPSIVLQTVGGNDEANATGIAKFVNLRFATLDLVDAAELVVSQDAARTRELGDFSGLPTLELKVVLAAFHAAAK